MLNALLALFLHQTIVDTGQTGAELLKAPVKHLKLRDLKNGVLDPRSNAKPISTEEKTKPGITPFLAGRSLQQSW